MLPVLSEAYVFSGSAFINSIAPVVILSYRVPFHFVDLIASNSNYTDHDSNYIPAIPKS
jgi:hypothetical protein